MTELDATSLNVLRRHAGLPEVYGEVPAAVQAAQDYILRQAQTVEAALGDGRPWLLEDGFSGADILLATCLDWARLRYGLPLSEGLLAFLGRATTRPATPRRGRRTNPTTGTAGKRPSTRRVAGLGHRLGKAHCRPAAYADGRGC